MPGGGTHPVAGSLGWGAEVSGGGIVRGAVCVGGGGAGELYAGGGSAGRGSLGSGPTAP